MVIAYAHDGSPADGMVITPNEMCREPRSLALVAWYDGWSRGAYPKATVRHVYPRRLDATELAQWREGFAEGRAERLSWSSRAAPWKP